MIVTVVPIPSGRLLSHRIQNLVPRYEKCLNCGGEYVENYINTCLSVHAPGKLTLWTRCVLCITRPSSAGVFKPWYAEGCQVVRHKVYKNIKLKNQTKQTFLLKERYKEQRSENMTPFTSHSGLRTLEISRILYHSVLL